MSTWACIAGFNIHNPPSCLCLAATQANIKEEGWVVCRVFKKKNPSRVSSSSLFPPNCHEPATGEDEELADHHEDHHKMNSFAAGESNNPKQTSFLLQLQQAAHPHVNSYSNTTCSPFGHGTNYYSSMINMHLLQLLTPPDHHDHHHATSSPATEAPNIGHTLVMMNNHDHSLDHPIISSSCGCTCAGEGVQPVNNVRDHDHPHSQQFTTNGAADWSFLDKFLASSHHHMSTFTGLGHVQGLGLDHHHQISKFNQLQQIIPSNLQPHAVINLGRDDHPHDAPNLSQMFPFQYLGHQN